MNKPENIKEFLEYAKENIPCIKVVIAGSRDIQTTNSLVNLSILF